MSYCFRHNRASMDGCDGCIAEAEQAQQARKETQKRLATYIRKPKAIRAKQFNPAEFTSGVRFSGLAEEHESPYKVSMGPGATSIDVFPGDWLLYNAAGKIEGVMRDRYFRDNYELDESSS